MNAKKETVITISETASRIATVGEFDTTSTRAAAAVASPQP